jgi:hypothetical protein
MSINAAAKNGAKGSLFSQLPGRHDAGIVRLRVVAGYRFRPVRHTLRSSAHVAKAVVMLIGLWTVVEWAFHL